MKKRKQQYLLAMAVLLLLQTAVLLYYGGRKAGFHEDELYTYYSSNKTAGLFVNDRQWTEQSEIRNDFVVLNGERFRYDVVRQMQSWDVHPPFYYFCFHTVCSLFPGVFSKWLGIAVNVIFYVGSYLLLAYAVYLAVRCGSGGSAGEEQNRKKAREMSFLVCLFWGFSGAVISGVMFIRMYQLLTFFVLLCLTLHLRAVFRQDFRFRSFLFPMMITVFLGFLTQYYYIIFHFFLGAGFCFYLLRNKRMKELFLYGFSCAAGLLAALVYYPSALSHIFRGYRGTEAVSEFGDASNTIDRLRFFLGLFDDYVMNGTLSVWILAIALLAVTLGYLKKRGKLSGRGMNPAVCLMLVTAAGYFFVVSKTALLLGETSNRYQLPVYGILCFLIIYGMWSCIEGLSAVWTGRKKTWRGTEALQKKELLHQDGGNSLKILLTALCLILLLIDGTALWHGRVFFLYEEERETMEFVKEHRDVPVIVFYNEASGDHIWWLSDELMEYPRVYLAGMGNPEPLADETIRNSDSLLVYLTDYEDGEECLEGLLEQNENLSSYQVIAEKGRGVWRLYEVW
ncbi:MAG: hypothetical protein NC429_06630 [Lachnospiraceae bacterium]|nr:hypothetical protein [Lachnospiraceae bacterium]